MTNQAFKRKVWDFYRHHGRVLPWRQTQNPYKILVSEIMLQQTQVDRVLPKYKAWLREFPTAGALAQASVAEVVTKWQGLGYNRRALALKRAAEQVLSHKKFPETYEKILALPGVGPYTAQAILAFAFNKPVLMIETNIRTVFLHHFFSKREKISDRELLPLLRKTLDKQNPREWYWALMDYGSFLKKSLGNASRRSAHYTKQSRFTGSTRQLRGAVLREVSAKPLTSESLQQQLEKNSLDSSPEKIVRTVQSLVDEGFLQKSRGKITLAS